ncbi:MAG TPA: VOC family protein [Steroidobacteraceae bacterium]|nr:VOC family protein [Steroidobacteraceae bacterium]
MQRIATNLWFDTQAEEAAKFYASIFRNSKIVTVTHYGEAGFEITGKKKGEVMTVEFELDGQQFYALNGGPMFKFNESVSLVVNCKDQAEVDEYWNKLLEGGKPSQCGWLKDKYGLSWQIVPTVLRDLMQDKDPQKSERVMTAMLKMVKLDVATLKRAAEQG